MNDEKACLETWQIWFAKYRATEKAVLSLEALRIGLRQGEITSDDLSHISCINRKVVGAVVKSLARSGMFERVGYTKSKLESAHGRVIGVWALRKHNSARLLLESVAATIDGESRTGNEKQLSFC